MIRFDKKNIFRKCAQLFIFLFALIAAVRPGLRAAMPPPVTPTLAHVVRQIDNQRGAWISLRADLKLNFVSPSQKTASCRGELLYQRLDEKILLRGFNAQGQPLFVFRTMDRQFELYLPSRGTLYRGDIFDLDDSPDIESQLQPLEFYRALKPMAVPLEFSEIEAWNAGTAAVKIIREKHRVRYLARRLLVSKDGQVPLETYYSFEGKPEIEIRRSDYRAVKAGKEKFMFPHSIAIHSRKNPFSTVLVFEKIQPNPVTDEKAWELAFLPGTQIVQLGNSLPPEE